MCRRKCVVGYLPCNDLTSVTALAHTDCEASATTHLCRVFVHVSVLVGKTVALSQLEAAPIAHDLRASAVVATLPKIRRRTLSVPYATPCTPPLHPRGLGDVLHLENS